jgi:poly(3-hydroxybutyrate) depolymerase
LLVATLVVVSGAVLAVTGLGADTQGARVLRFTIASRFVHRSLPVVAVVPAGAGSRRRPLLVFLHGKGGDESSELDDAMFAALARLGPRARPSCSRMGVPTPTGTIVPTAGGATMSCAR